MRLTLRLLGREVLHITTEADEAEAPDGASLDGGTTTAYPLGFTVPSAPPYEFEPPPHVEWGD